MCLATLGFLQVYRPGLRNPKTIREVDELRELCSQRLTAAMVGLLRSFTVNTFDLNDPPGQTLCAMLNQRGAATEILVRDLLEDLAEIRACLRQELTIGLGQVAEELENRGRLFECGWSWGVVDGAPVVRSASNVGEQPAGVAEARPYLYFTVTALDGIRDLFSERTRILGLLDEEQQRLARALHYSVLLASIVIEGGGVDVDRIGRLLEELANRGRITRRPTENDPGIELHIPGMRLRLIGSEKVADGPRLQWTVSSHALLVLKRVLRVAEMLRTAPPGSASSISPPTLDAHRASADRNAECARARPAAAGRGRAPV